MGHSCTVQWGHSTLSLIQNLHGQTIVTGLPAGLTRVLVRSPVRSNHRTHTVLLQSATLGTLALGLVGNHQTDLRGHCAVKLITGTIWAGIHVAFLDIL